MNFIDNLDTYGTYKFKGKVAAPYLKAQGLPVDTLENPTWTHTLADKVAKAVVEWCKDKGATMATHWFQPLGSAGVRRGRMSNTGASAAPPAARLWLGQRQVQSMPASRLGRPRAAGRRVLVGRPTRYEALWCPKPSRRVRASAELLPRQARADRAGAQRDVQLRRKRRAQVELRRRRPAPGRDRRLLVHERRPARALCQPNQNPRLAAALAAAWQAVGGLAVGGLAACSRVRARPAVRRRRTPRAATPRSTPPRPSSSATTPSTSPRCDRPGGRGEPGWVGWVAWVAWVA